MADLRSLTPKSHKKFTDLQFHTIKNIIYFKQGKKSASNTRITQIRGYIPHRSKNYGSKNTT